MIRLGFAGDVCLASVNQSNFRSLLESCRRCQELTRRTDIAVGNFECCVVEADKNCPRFMAIPETQSGVISEAGFDVLSLANNHVMDCGEEGLIFTQSYLQKLNINTVGAGRNSEEANSPLILTHAGKRIALIAATDATHCKATSDRAGIAALSLKRLKKWTRAITDHVDVVVLCIHSDLEFTNYPAPWKVRMSRELARAGADIVIHHHPHTLQGIELYDNALIAYSLGNFIFPVHGPKYMRDRRGHVDEGIFLEVCVDCERQGTKAITYSVIPTVIDRDNTLKRAEGERAERILERMRTYCGYLRDSGVLRRRYFRACRQQGRDFAYGTYYSLRRNGFLDTINYVRGHFATQMHRNWMRGLGTLGWY